MLIYKMAEWVSYNLAGKRKTGDGKPKILVSLSRSWSTSVLQKFSWDENLAFLAYDKNIFNFFKLYTVKLTLILQNSLHTMIFTPKNGTTRLGPESSPQWVNYSKQLVLTTDYLNSGL